MPALSSSCRVQLLLLVCGLQCTKPCLPAFIYCRMSFEAASTVFAGQAMQNPTVHPPAEATKTGNANISEVMTALKLSDSNIVPCDETGKALT